MAEIANKRGEAIPAQRPRVHRVFSYPVILIACQAAAVATIYVINTYLPEYLSVMLTDHGRSTYPLTVQNVTWLMFGLGIGELIVRMRDALAERAQLSMGYLPEDEATILQAPELRRIYAAARTVHGRGRRANELFLPRLILRVVTQFQTNKSVDQANAVLNSSLELFLHEIDLRYTIVRYTVWAIPALGFIGTVMGISLALAYAGSVDIQNPDLLAELTKRLAVAFNTTLLALAMSGVLVFVQHVVQAYDERALNETGQYCLDNLINRLYVD